MPLLEEVARNLRPTPAIRALADRMVAKLGPFNGVHLRLEDDARYQDHMGGQDVRLPVPRPCPDILRACIA